MKATSKILKAATAAVLSVGLCFGAAATANAGETLYQYAVSSGSIERGTYRGSWYVRVSESYVTVTSFSATVKCLAVQDGHTRVKSTAGRGDRCTSQDTGTGTLANRDYVMYGLE